MRTAPVVGAAAVKLPLGQTRAAFRPETVLPSTRTVELVWTTGARVRRFGWDGDWFEELALDDGAVDLGRLNRGANLIESHRSYTLDGVLGVVEWARLDDLGDGKREGRALVRFSDRPKAQEIFADVQSGIIRNVSVGYITHELEQVEKPTRDAPGVYRATRWEPVELSLCAVPADAGAQVRANAPEGEWFPCTIREGRNMGQESTTVDAPTRRKATTRPARSEERPEGAPEPGVDDVEDPPPPPPADPDVNTEDAAAAARAATAAERTRAQEITSRVRLVGLDPELAQRWINDGTPLAEVERAVFAELAKRQAPPVRSAVQVVGAGIERMRNGIINALLHRIAPQKNELNEDGKNWRSQSLMEIGRTLLEARGVLTGPLGKMELAGVALGIVRPPMQREGPHGFLATSDLAVLLATIGRTTLTEGYKTAERSFPPWTRQGTLPDFRVSTRVSLGLGPQLLSVPEHAEYSRGKLVVQGQPVQLGTWGRILAFTRQAMVNDDVSLFTRIPQLFGNAAAALEGNVVYNLLISNPLMADGNALFSAPHNNLMTASIIDIKNVGLARAAMMNQKSADGQYITIMPKFMIVGPLQEVYAYQFMTPITIVGPVSNVVPEQLRQMQVIVDPRITDYSWYLAASPNQIDTIEYDYLAGGTQGPELETREGWDVDGQEYKAREDFTAAVIDWRGLVKNPGVAPA